MTNSKKYYWLKLKEDFFRDKKIKKLRKIAGGDTYTIIYLKMQLLSLKTDGLLFFDGIEDTFAEELALEIDEKVDDIRVCLMFLTKNELLEYHQENEEYLLTEAKSFVGSETQTAERMRKMRAKKQKQLCEVNCNNVTRQLQNVTQR